VNAAYSVLALVMRRCCIDSASCNMLRHAAVRCNVLQQVEATYSLRPLFHRFGEVDAVLMRSLVSLEAARAEATMRRRALYGRRSKPHCPKP
jgi:hypothetical protein